MIALHWVSWQWTITMKAQWKKMVLYRFCDNVALLHVLYHTYIMKTMLWRSFYRSITHPSSYFNCTVSPCHSLFPYSIPHMQWNLNQGNRLLNQNIFLWISNKLAVMDNVNGLCHCHLYKFNLLLRCIELNTHGTWLRSCDNLVQITIQPPTIMLPQMNSPPSMTQSIPLMLNNVLQLFI